jgi:flagellar biosynthetic protein FliR
MFEALALSEAVRFALVLARIAGFVVVSPFPGSYVSHTQRAGLAAVVAWVASGYAPLAPAAPGLDLRLAITVATEVGAGVVMGSAFRFLYVAADFLGTVVSQAVGLSMATVLNPATRGEDAALARVVTLLAELLALGAGIHRVALSYVLQSFRALPVGRTLDFSPTAPLLTDLAVRSIEVGLQIGMPVVAVCLVVHLGLAMIARAAPALQILHVGLGLLLATGGFTLVTVLPDMGRALLTHYASLASVLDQAIGRLSGGSP